MFRFDPPTNPTQAPIALDHSACLAPRRSVVSGSGLHSSEGLHPLIGLRGSFFAKRQREAREDWKKSIPLFELYSMPLRESWEPWEGYLLLIYY